MAMISLTLAIAGVVTMWSIIFYFFIPVMVKVWKKKDFPYDQLTNEEMAAEMQRVTALIKGRRIIKTMGLEFKDINWNYLDQDKYFIVMTCQGNIIFLSTCVDDYGSPFYFESEKNASVFCDCMGESINDLFHVKIKETVK